MMLYISTRLPKKLREKIVEMLNKGYPAPDDSEDTEDTEESPDIPWPPEDDQPDKKDIGPRGEPAGKYRVAVHYDSATVSEEQGEKAAKVAAAYIEGALNKIWPTEAVVGKKVPEELAKDKNYHDYGRWAQSESGVEAHQHILVASTTGSHGGPSFSRVDNSDDLAKLEPEYQEFGRGWEHGIVSVALHEIAHGLGAGEGFGPDHGDGTRIDGCQTPMDSASADCYAHKYSRKSSKKILRYMEEKIGYKSDSRNS